MRSSLPYTLFALVLFAVTWCLTATPRVAESAPAPMSIETLSIQPTSLRSVVTLSGRVEPVRSALIMAQVSAPVLTRFKQLGDPVSQGDLIVELDAEQARLQSRQAEAALSQAQAGYGRLQADLEHSRVQVHTQSRVARAGLSSARASRQKQSQLTRPQELESARADWQAARAQAEQSEREWLRLEMLWKEGAISDQDRERGRLAVELARRREVSSQQGLRLAEEGARGEDQQASEANLETARAGWELAQAGPLQSEALRHQLGEAAALIQRQQAVFEESRVQLDRHQIRAPFSGRILEILVERGDSVRPGTGLCRVGQIDRVKVHFDAPESLRPQLNEHQSVRLECASLPGKSFSGQIRRLGYQADSQSHTFPIEVELANPGLHLLPNMLARLDLPVGPAHPRILVPVSSLAFDSGLSYVYVIEKGVARRREVVVGALQPNQQVIVEEGLQAQDRVALQPFRLSPGLAVQTQ